MGAGTGDILRLGRPMDAVTLEGETDPSGADGVVGAGRKNKTVSDALLLGGEGEDFGVEGVVGIGGDIGDGQGLVGYLGFVGGDGAREACDHLVVGVEGEEGGFRDHNHDSANRRKFAGTLQVGKGELGAGGEVGDGRIELTKEGRSGVRLLGQHFPRVMVIECRHFAHFQVALGTRNDAGEILGGDGVVDVGVAGLAKVEAGFDIQFPGGGEAAMNLKLGDGAATALRKMAVDRAAGEVQAIKQGLPTAHLDNVLGPVGGDGLGATDFFAHRGFRRAVRRRRNRWRIRFRWKGDRRRNNRRSVSYSFFLSASGPEKTSASGYFLTRSLARSAGATGLGSGSLRSPRSRR